MGSPHLLASRMAARKVTQILLRVGLAMAIPVQRLGRPVLCPTGGEACVFSGLLTDRAENLEDRVGPGLIESGQHEQTDRRK